MLPSLSQLSIKTDAVLNWSIVGTEPQIKVSFHDAVAVRIPEQLRPSRRAVRAKKGDGNAIGGSGEEPGEEDPLEDESIEYLLSRQEEAAEQLQRSQGPPSETVKGKRPRSDGSSRGESTPLDPDYTLLAEEYGDVVLWLRLCRVPSEPAGTTGFVKDLPSEEKNYSLTDTRTIEANKKTQTVIDAANAALLSIAERMKAPALLEAFAIDDTTITRDIRQANALVGSRLRMPHMRSLNADGEGTKKEHMYMEWLFEDASFDRGYTGDPLPSVEQGKAWVEHVVPKSWMRQSEVLLEFASATNDPTNVLYSLEWYNRTKGKSAVRFGGTGAFDYAAHNLWAPQGFTRERQAVLARIVAYSFLTYPAIAADSDTTLERSGVPQYAASYRTIIALCNDPVGDAELWKAWVVYGMFGVVNPLVVSSKVRAMVADSSTKLSQLLLARMRGRDRCTLAVFRELRHRGVAFEAL